MRKVTSGLFISVDGVVESPEKWQFDVFDQDMIRIMGEYLATTDTVLLGRVTYQEWQPYWPNASTDEMYANFINNAPKYVFSKTLTGVDWNNAHLVEGSLEDKVKQLKQRTGKNIAVQGSPTLVRSLLECNLMDELTLMFHPVVVGSGKKFFTDASEVKRLKLVQTMTTGSGVIVATYHPM